MLDIGKNSFPSFRFVDNWVRELKLWCPSLKVVVYYGKTLHPYLDPSPHKSRSYTPGTEIFTIFNSHFRYIFTECSLTF